MADALTDDQRRQLSEAILSGYRRPQELGRMIRLGTGERLDVIADPGTLPDRVLDVIEWFESEGRIDDLVSAAAKDKPRNPELVAIAAELGLGTAPARGAYMFADPSTFDLTDLEDEFLSRKDAHPGKGPIAFVVRYGESMFLAAFTARICSILGPGTETREPITLLPYIQTPQEAVKEIEGYRAALERVNLVCVVQAESAPSEQIQVVWAGVRRLPADLRNYLVLLFTTAPSTEFPPDIWELPKPRFVESEVRRWTSRIAQSQRWPDEESRAWTKEIREQAWDEESQTYVVRSVYQNIRDSLAALRQDPQAFRARLQQRSE